MSGRRRPTGPAEPSPPAIVSDEVVVAFQNFVGEVFRLNGQLLSTAAVLAGDIGISPARWQTIAVIRNEALPVAQIARQLGLRRQSVQQNVDQLVAQGLAELHPNPQHQKAKLVALTKEGRLAMRKLAILQGQLTSHFVGDSGLSAHSLGDLTRTLHAMRSRVEAIE